MAIAFGWQNSASQGDDVRSEADASLRVNTVPAVLAFNAKQDGADADTVAPSLLAMPHDKSHANGGGQLAVCIPLQEIGKRTGTSTTDPRAGIGIGADGDPMYTLQASAQHGVVCTTGEITHALTHEGHDASEDGTGRGTPIIANCVTAREAKGWNPASAVGNGTISHGIPRRLMPVECERLMSWPTGHTDVHDENGKPASDSLRYKACGNGVVSNVAQWIGERLLAVHRAMQSQDGTA